MTLELLRSFLGWVAICNIVLTLVTFFLCAFCHSWLYRVQSHFFHVPQEALTTILYASVVFFKLLNIAFFIVPYCVLRFLV
jgi:hypothetical protein